MALSASQYADMRLRLRIALAGGYGNASLSNAELNSFINQLSTDGALLSALGASSQSQFDSVALLLMSGSDNNPAFSDISIFWTQALSDASGAAALATSRYQYLRTELANRIGATFDDAARYVVPQVLGSVGGRNFVHTNIGAPNAPYAVQIFDFARDNIYQMAIDWPNFAQETATGGTLTVNWAHVEYPIGTFTRLTFSGASSGSVGSSTKLLSSDLVTLAVPIPAGAKYRIRWSWQCSGSGIPFALNSSGLTQYVPGGDAIIQTATDYSMGQNGAFVDANTTLSMWPANILGMTRRRRLAIVGDSRNSTGAGVADSLGEQGEIGRSLGQLYGHANVAIAGTQAAQWVAGSANRMATLTRANPTDIIYAYGINDVTSGVNVSTLNDYDATIAAQFSAAFPNAKFWYCTMPPRSNSTDNWATLANQSAPGGSYIDATRTSVNATRRAKPYYLEIADVMESARDSGKWKVDGTANKYTPDGTHETLFANDQIGTGLPF